MTYGDYITVSSDDPTYASYAKRLTAYLREATIQYGLRKKPEEMDDADRATLAEREGFALTAIRNALPVDGRFPVIFYHPGLGGTYEDNGVFCEYLASHGYLVVGSAYQAEDDASLNVNWDLDRSIKDLGFLMNFMAAVPQADMTRIGAVGQSYGAQALLAWSSETNAPVQAVVSLDSTADYAASDDTRFAKLKTPLSRAENVKAAWLLFAVKDRKPNWSQWDHLIHTPRWFAETGPMGHDDFIAQGLIGTVLRHEDAHEADLIRRRYDAVCELAHCFLDSYVKKDDEAKHTLMRQVSPPTGGEAAASATPSTDPLPTLTYKPPSSDLASV